jgi:hypothetical protein
VDDDEDEDNETDEEESDELVDEDEEANEEAEALELYNELKGKNKLLPLVSFLKWNDVQV